MEETTKAIKESCEDQKKGVTTFIEIILNQELGEPFRRDAMKKPVKVAGIDPKRYEAPISLDSFLKFKISLQLLYFHFF